MSKKLYRSDSDKMIAGVCGGFAEFFNIDSTVIRLAFVLLALITAILPVILFYAIAYFVVPEAST
ncbi:PspC domain-containing protein [Natranaerobius thermophilus]|uniref:Phage shock protein C, PspC n=1 Tax=Natranaerobius thermophilus (strain ATCC BAA-1301 / DSM 18059 / JW/NM-WN-LF) TaxID=457570 RepID=B2A0M6_NATTJ|nr:PspC domain-containing protein [Natranaerobius thermophilus]ACB84584.1 phage shock protein C, PspC [Natranaerobius thermophilus JW/NM-WN-LF]